MNAVPGCEATVDILAKNIVFMFLFWLKLQSFPNNQVWRRVYIRLIFFFNFDYMATISVHCFGTGWDIPLC